jgi:hypothetical protein
LITFGLAAGYCVPDEAIAGFGVGFPDEVAAVRIHGVQADEQPVGNFWLR